MDKDKMINHYIFLDYYLEPGPAGSSDQGTGQNSGDPGDVRTSKRTKTAPPLVERVTALR